MTPRARWPVAAIAATGLSLSAPGVAAGAGWLVLPGLAALYAVATGSPRPYRCGYAIGLVHLLVVSWSLRHVTFAGYVAIALVGAFYVVLAVAATRARCGLRLPRALAFGVAIAASEWLRAHMPEIAYPHAQPCHALYEHPAWLGPVRWGGEVLANLLLACGAAAAVDAYRSWRVARPRPRHAVGAIALAASPWLLTCTIAPPAAPSDAAGAVDVAAIEPGFEPAFQFDAARFVEEFERAVLAPTRQLAQDDARRAPDLVLWPETASTAALDGDPPRLLPRGFRAPLAPSTRLVLTAQRRSDDGYHTSAAVVDDRGRLLGWQDKVAPVPIGEMVPWLRWLPRAWRESLFAGRWPDLRGGVRREPMTTARGVRFGALVCFDNAFDDIVRDAVDGGARFLVVLSNESWYRGGAELEQMVAMSVLRALETATPMVRCTVDGASVHVAADGRIVARLPARRGPDDRAPRILRTEVAPGPGQLPPLAWLHRVAASAAVLALLAVVWHALRAWARLLATRPGGSAKRARAAAVPGHPSGGLDRT